MIPVEWTYDEFLTFVLIYTAFADYEIFEEQKELITHKVSSKKYKELLDYFMQNDDAINISLINELKNEYLKSQDDIDNMLDTIFEIIKVNGFVNKLEKETYDNLKFILNM